MKTWRIVQQIYEEGDPEPVLTHVFYGKTREEAAGVFKAHMGTDSFMRGCVTNGRFRDFTCRAADHTEKLGPDGQWLSVPER
jgi:hypothetical protein